MAITQIIAAADAPSSADVAAISGDRSFDIDHAAVAGIATHVFLTGPSLSLRQLPLMTFVAIPWFFYRKMFVIGTLALLGTLMVASQWPIAATVLLPAQGLATRPAYRRFVRSRVAKADARALTGDRRQAYLERSGGTSLAAACFATAVVVPMLAVLILRRGIL